MMMADGVSVFSGTACRLGEGPTYDPATNRVFWFDIVGRRLLEKEFPDGAERVHELPFMASALAVIDDRRQMLATEHGLYLRDARDGTLTPHTPIEADNPVTRSNDARVHQSGAFWIGTMGKGHEHHAGSIYWYFKGEVRQLYSGMTVTNSICFSPDASVAYFTDTRRNVVMRVDCDPANGLPRGEPAAFIDQHGVPGGMDGSVVDAEGVLWNARWGQSRVDAYAPDGTRLRSVEMPARQVSCPAFVGGNAGRMIVTSAWNGMDEAARAADPDAGRTFLLDLPVKGRFEPKVAL
jgi:sugar lactone lactonase YvrE